MQFKSSPVEGTHQGRTGTGARSFSDATLGDSPMNVQRLAAQAKSQPLRESLDSLCLLAADGVFLDVVRLVRLVDRTSCVDGNHEPQGARNLPDR